MTVSVAHLIGERRDNQSAIPHLDQETLLCLLPSLCHQTIHVDCVILWPSAPPWLCFNKNMNSWAMSKKCDRCPFTFYSICCHEYNDNTNSFKCVKTANKMLPLDRMKKCFALVLSTARLPVCMYVVFYTAQQRITSPILYPTHIGL